MPQTKDKQDEPGYNPRIDGTEHNPRVSGAVHNPRVSSPSGQNKSVSEDQAPQKAKRLLGLKEGESKAESNDPFKTPEGPEGSLYKSGVSPRGGSIKNKMLKMFTKNGKPRYGPLGLGVGSILGFVLLLLVLGPGQWIHMASMFQDFHFGDHDAVSSSRVKKMFMYAKYGDIRSSRLGYFANKHSINIENRLGQKGWTIEGDSQRFRGFVYDPNDPRGTDADKKSRPTVEEMKAKVEAEGARNVRIEGDRLIVPNDGSKFWRNRALIRTVYSTVYDVGKMTRAMDARILIRKLGITWDPLTKVQRNATGAVADRIKQHRQQKLSTDSVDATARARADSDDPEENEKQRKAEADGNKAIEDAKSGGAQNIRRAAAGAGGLTMICAVKSIAEFLDDDQKRKIMAVYFNLATEGLGVPSKIMDGRDVGAEEVEEYAKSLHSSASSEQGKSSWSEASSIRYELGQEGGKVLPDHYNPNPGQSAVNQFFQDPEVKKYVDGPCQVLTSTAAQIILLPFEGVAGVIIELGIAAYGDEILQFIADIVNDNGIDFSDPNVAGAVYGEGLNVAVRMVSNEQMYGMGGRTLTDDEETQNRAIVLEEENLQRSTQNIASKYFDPSNYKSFAGRTLLNFSSTPIYSQLTSLPSSIFGNFLKMPFMGTAFANDGLPGVPPSSAYYGINKASFNLNTLDNDNWEIPNKNAREAKQILADPNEGAKYINLVKICHNVEVFGLQANEELDFIQIGGSEGNPTYIDQKKLPKECNSGTDIKLEKIRYALYDTIKIKSLACLEFGDGEACEELYKSTNDLTGQNGTSGGTGQFTVASLNVLGESHTDGGPGDKKGYDNGVQRMRDQYNQLITPNNISLIGFQEFEKPQRDEFNRLAGGEWSVHPADGNNSNLQASNSVAWRTSEFDVVSKGIYKDGLRYFTGSGTRTMWLPWVELKHKQSGQVIHFTNTHDPINRGGANAQVRASNARTHLANAKAAVSKGDVEFIITGDFNSGFKTDTGSRAPSRDALPYCILTKDGTLYNSYDTSEGRTYEKNGACPIKDSTNMPFRAIDHIYHSTNLGISQWDRIPTPTSDHPLILADITIDSATAGGSASTSCADPNSNDIYWPVANVEYVNTHDFRVSEGSPVYAITSGKVIASYDITQSSNPDDCTSRRPCNDGLYSYGRVIKIDHGLPQGSITYAHLKQRLVKNGDPIAAGQLIGYSGNSGNSFGPHLHVDFNGNYTTIPWLEANSPKKPPCRPAAAIIINQKHYTFYSDKSNKQKVAA